MKSSASNTKKKAKGSKRRPQKKDKALNAVKKPGKYTVKQKSKGNKNKKGKSSTTSDVAAVATVTELVKVSVPLVDPWKSLKSTYGGKASPADEFNKLLSWHHHWSKIDATVCRKTGNTSTRILQSGMLFQFWKEAEKLFYENQTPKPGSEEHIQGVEGNSAESSESQTSTLADRDLVGTVQVGSVDSKYVVRETIVGEDSKKNLEEVEARKHRLSCVSMDISELILGFDMQNQLIGLDLTDNSFTSASMGRLNALYLRELIVTGNQISEFPNLTHLPSLLILDLSYNPIKTFTDDTKKTFSVCKNLRIVRLECCELEDDDGSGGIKFSLIDYFCLLANVLEELNIGNNLLMRRHNVESLKSCKRVRSLVVHGNPCTLKVTGEALPPVFDMGEIDTEWCLKLAMKFGGLKMYNNRPYSHSIKSFNSNCFSLTSELGATSGAGDDAANCSCVEGNPCVVPYNCKNWAKRFEISRRARENKDVQM